MCYDMTNVIVGKLTAVDIPQYWHKWVVNIFKW